jgi:hypothetical protein
MNQDQLELVFGRERIKMATGDHVEVFREATVPGERRRYTKRFLETGDADFRLWTDREWRILARLIGHGVRCVPDVVQYHGGAEGGVRQLQTYDAGISVDQWTTLVPVARGAANCRHVFEDCAHWWSLAHHCLSALDEIHALHVVHLDIKADNICIPFGPPTFDPALDGERLHVAFGRLALIDFAFSLVSRETLGTPLPIGWEKDYDYQSPRLLSALEAGRAGDLVATQELDWRCDLYSLAAMLRRYLCDDDRVPTDVEGGWTAARRNDARSLIFRLRACHDGALVTRRPHRELMELTGAHIGAPDLARSLAAGWTLVRDRELASPSWATPMTRIVPGPPPRTRRTAIRPTPIVVPETAPSVIRHARSNDAVPEPALGLELATPTAPAPVAAAATRRRAAWAGAAVLAALGIVSAWAHFSDAPDAWIERARTALAQWRPIATERAPSSASTPTDAPAAQAPAASTSATTTASAPAPAATTPGPAPTTASSGQTASTDSAASSAGNASTQAAALRTPAPHDDASTNHAVAAPAGPAQKEAQPPTMASESAPPAAASAGRAPSRFTVGANGSTASKPSARASTNTATAQSHGSSVQAAPSARPRPPEPTPSSTAAARAAPYDAAAARMATADLTRRATRGTAPFPGSGDTPVNGASDPAPLAAPVVTPLGDPAPLPPNATRAAPRESSASHPGGGDDAAVRAAPVPAESRPPSTDNSRPPASSPRSSSGGSWREALDNVLRTLGLAGQSPAPVEDRRMPERSVASGAARSVTPSVPPTSAAPLATQTLPSAAPRLATYGCEPNCGRTQAELSEHARQMLAGTVPRLAAQAWVDASPLLAMANVSATQRELADTARSPWRSEQGNALSTLDSTQARHLHDASRSAFASGRRGEALNLGLRAFAADPRDPDMAGFLAYLYLQQTPVQAETARELALQALVVSGPGRVARYDDWNTFAVASALTGRDSDATRAFLLGLALSGDADRTCRAATRAYAMFGERMRGSLDPVLMRLRSTPDALPCSLVYRTMASAR